MITSSSNEQFNNLLRQRTMTLAADVRHLLKTLVLDSMDKSIAYQLIRSSSSVAANYSSATRGRSDAKYYSKLCIVVEETDETKFWLDYIVRIGLTSGDEVKRIQDETEQLIRLFSTIKKKMKEKIERNKKSQNHYKQLLISSSHKSKV
jgi:four helix bundle protein